MNGIDSPFKNILVPTFFNVLLEVVKEEKETTTESGIIISNQSLKSSQLGKIIRIGYDDLDDLDIEVGETIVFKKNKGERVSFEGIEYIIIEQSDILAKVKQEKETKSKTRRKR